MVKVCNSKVDGRKFKPNKEAFFSSAFFFFSSQL